MELYYIYISFWCLLFISLIITSSKFIHIAVNVRMTFLFKAEKYSLYINLVYWFICQQTLESLLPFISCKYCCKMDLQQLHVHAFNYVWRYNSEVELFNRGNFVSLFKEPPFCLPWWLVLFYISTSNAKRVPIQILIIISAFFSLLGMNQEHSHWATPSSSFPLCVILRLNLARSLVAQNCRVRSPQPPKCWACKYAWPGMAIFSVFINKGYLDGYEVVSHYSFNLYFSMN